MKLPWRAVLLSGMAAILVIGVSGALLLPRLIDSQMIKNRISSELVKKTTVTVTFDKIALLWFPWPSVVIENAELSFADKNQGSIRTLRIYPSIFYLLTGRLVVRRALLQEPNFRIHLPERFEKPFDLEELEKQIRSALARFTRDFPAPIDIDDGSAEIRIDDKPAVILENVAAQTVGSPAELRFELSARSNLCEHLKIEGKISPQSLASQLDIGLQRLKIKDSLALLPSQIFEYVRQGEASLDVKMASVGLRKLKASVRGSVGRLVFAWHGPTVTTEAKSVKGEMTYEDGVVQVDVEQLNLGAPRLQASGQLKVRAGSLSARIRLRDVDIAEVRDMALRTVGDVEGVKRIFLYVPAGKIPDMSIEAAGRSVADMASVKNMVVSAVMRNGKIFIPSPALELKDVSGSVRIADNVLEAKDIAGNLGTTTKAWNGKLRLGLEAKTAPFHLDVAVQTGAPELQTVLLKLVRDEAFRRELLKVRNVEGELSGRLILGETLDAVSPVVAIAKANISATYEPVPFPIAIRGGRFNYDRQIITVEDAQGSVGRSTFGGLAMTLHHDGSRRIKVNAKQMALDLRQSATWLRSMKERGAYFAKLQSARGQVELDNLTVTGAYDDPAGWNFTSTGTFKHLEIRHADFPDRIALAHGKFVAHQGRIRFSDTTAAMSDAALIAGGTFEYTKEGAFQSDISGTGTVGAQMTQRLSRYVELPEDLKLRSPLKISAGHFTWRAGGDISFRGRVTVARGPQISLDAVKQPWGLALRNLTIDDGDRHARMTLQLAKDNLDLSFSGELTQQMIDRLFASFPMKGSSLRGDFQAHAVLASPITVSARGQLSGSNLLVPLGTEKALLEAFSLEANAESVLVRSAELRWGASRLAMSGKVTGAKDALRVDADVTADQLDGEELQRFFDSERKQRQQEHGQPIPPIEGVIRLKTDRFRFERFNFSPLEIKSDISPLGVRAEIKRGVVCGIDATGNFEVGSKDIGLDLQLSAADAQLEPTTICLTNRQSEVKGTYSLTARIGGRGDREHWRSSLKGDFQLSARDGEFVRSAGIDATFDYLNKTGDFNVKFPDLNKQAFPYSVLTAKGKIDGETLLSDEIVIQATPLTVTGEGSFDLQRKQVDVKGLVSVGLPANQVIKSIPIIGAVIGGSLVGIPIRISGSMERPEVSYLSPADIGGELLSLPMKILGAPLDAIRLFVPSGEKTDKNSTR